MDTTRTTVDNPLLQTILNYLTKYRSSSTPQEQKEVRLLETKAIALKANAPTKEDIANANLFQTEKEVTVNSTKFIVVEGDIVLTKEQFEKYDKSRKVLKTVNDIDPTVVSSVSLLGMVNEFNRLIRWAPQVARNLTYWIDNDSFKDSNPKAGEIQKYMLFAATSWAFVCGVNFLEVTNPEQAIFKVAYNTQNSQPGLMASAFFPNSPLQQRILWIYPDFSRTGFDMPGILRHELGHILGFRHEHVRLKAYHHKEPTDDIFEITSYDSKSVMHYFLPPYGGSKDGEITNLDAAGAMFYYGPPLHKFTEFPH